ncbi:type I-C CRISPR-associated protein Cas7/Csd2 [Pseudodesulfovibrio indicus]|jgi:CRISPR-associated protein Csd2|uniref:CRISPR-associated Csd2 family protein n=1 Tax=Pseudodesulfovibrio indicus TaxID=1716143 RepID=A0A126QRB6_9BACT|nr:type I-C CRISPR-associated protein Cas7/Csd2 [Pseudodesulfovibrio indicus]AMK12504.1 type I-C CRISPR-associated protein Cas7/Csd2 [Pseudodesulfovibrio indicus]TDT90812.1 CRISPR-associated Csd2 family protein [Pseudodesulfovibrio indicus]
MAAINNRYEFVYLFDVENGNPNGDPDAGNTPRIDPETGHGLVTDVCLKRKVRNYVDIVKQGAEGYNIYVAEKGVLSQTREPAYKTEEVKKLKKKDEQIAAARQWMCGNFFDVRTFGAVMSTKENNCGQVRGPVQLTFAKSIEPIVPAEVSITRMAVETAKEAEAQEGDNRTMGRKHIVPYGLYRAEGFISANLAQGDKGTGFSEADLDLLWQALANMFDHDHSAARGKMSPRGLIVFKHQDALGNAPAHKLFEAVTVTRKAGDGPARSFADYEVAVDKAAIPGTVELDVKF